MLTSYTRRRQWEAKVQAIEIWNLLAQAMGDGKGTPKQEQAEQRMKGSLQPKANVKMSTPEAVLKMAGVKL